MAVIQGMSALAKDGADRRKQLRIVESAKAGWPNQPPSARAIAAPSSATLPWPGLRPARRYQ